MRSLRLSLLANVLALGACSSGVESTPLGNGGANGGGGSGNGSGGNAPGGTTSLLFTFDSGPSTSTGPTADANCGGQVTDLKRRPPNILLVLDRSASMSDSGKGNIWTFVVPAVEGIIQSTQNDLQWGLEMFPLGGGNSSNECTAATLPKVADINPQVALGNYAAILAQIPATATGDGTPTDTAILTATAYLKSVQNDYPRYILLATDGVPSCVGAASSSTSNGVKTGVTAAVSAISAAAAAGIPTFVVGVNSPSSASSLSDLTAMADAGGVGLPHAICPPGAGASTCTGSAYTGFYLATDQAGLASALNKIIGAVNSCQIQLSKLPPDPSFVAVKVTDAAGNSSQIFQKGSGAETSAGAWSYVDAGNTVVQLEGAACSTISAGAGGTFEIWFGCNSVPVF
jgi:hypothetical protein